MFQSLELLVRICFTNHSKILETLPRTFSLSSFNFIQIKYFFHILNGRQNIFTNEFILSLFKFPELVFYIYIASKSREDFGLAKFDVVHIKILL